MSRRLWKWSTVAGFQLKLSFVIDNIKIALSDLGVSQG